MSIAVLGAGAFGTALAVAIARERSVVLWARDPGEMAETRENVGRLPGVRFPDRLKIATNIEAALEQGTILLAVPLQTLRSVLKALDTSFNGHAVACCKGVELQTGMGPTRLVQENLPHCVPAVLTGPSFAVDIAQGLPTALTLACRDIEAGRALQQILSTKSLRLYRSTDTIGAELGGALKNVIAIACGAAVGAGLGESARAALMTRGFAEMQRLAAFRGADKSTLAGLSGFGDLTLTCTSEKSRNYRFGLALGRGQGFDPSTTVEGVATARAVHAIALDTALDLPITRAVAALIDQTQTVDAAMQDLLARPLKEE